MQRKKRLTKRERKEADPLSAERSRAGAPHIHCISCGRHLDPAEFSGSSPTALYIVCQHRSRFPACTVCEAAARYLVQEHDRTGNAVQTAAAWH
jgi:hypothetical protein